MCLLCFAAYRRKEKVEERHHPAVSSTLRTTHYVPSVAAFMRHEVLAVEEEGGVVENAFKMHLYDGIASKLRMRSSASCMR